MQVPALSVAPAMDEREKQQASQTQQPSPSPEVLLPQASAQSFKRPVQALELRDRNRELSSQPDTSEFRDRGQRPPP